MELRISITDSTELVLEHPDVEACERMLAAARVMPKPVGSWQLNDYLDEMRAAAGSAVPGFSTRLQAAA
jgi:hypothetical protein